MVHAYSNCCVVGSSNEIPIARRSIWVCISNDFSHHNHKLFNPQILPILAVNHKKVSVPPWCTCSILVSIWMHTCMHVWLYRLCVKIVRVRLIMLIIQSTCISSVRRDHTATAQHSPLAWLEVEYKWVKWISFQFHLVFLRFECLFCQSPWQLCAWIASPFWGFCPCSSLVAKISVCEFMWLSWVVKNGLTLSGGIKWLSDGWPRHSCMTSITRQNPKFFYCIHACTRASVSNIRSNMCVCS